MRVPSRSTHGIPDAGRTDVARGLGRSRVVALLAALGVAFGAHADPVYVAKGSVLYQEDGETRRLLIEPGTLVHHLDKRETFEQGALYEVQTPTGITGLMRERDVEVFPRAPENIAFVKKDFVRRSIAFTAGDLHPFERIDDLDEVLFEVDKGIARYVVSEGGYIVKRVRIRLDRADFAAHMNVVTEAKLRDTRFFLWKQLTDRGAKVSQSWGCGESSKVVDFLAAGAEAEFGAGASFWTWFTSKFGTYLRGSTESSWTIEKRDEEYRHKLSFWNLEDNDGQVALRMVIDRISDCPPAESSEISYEFSFPDNEVDSVQITHAWVTEQGFRYKGTNVPLTLVNLADLQHLQQALTSSGYLRFDAGQPYADHVRDQIVKIAAAVLPPAE